MLEALSNLLTSAKAAERYIVQVGLNHTEQGKPHPQEQLLLNLQKAITEGEWALFQELTKLSDEDPFNRITDRT